jgi:hypothetical protein
MTAIIHFQPPTDRSQRYPWPVAIDGNHVVQSGLAEDDGARLVGFARPGQHSLAVSAGDGLEYPDRVVGMVPIFLNAGGVFNWDLRIQSIEWTGALTAEGAN